MYIYICVNNKVSKYTTKLKEVDKSKFITRDTNNKIRQQKIRRDVGLERQSQKENYNTS